MCQNIRCDFFFAFMGFTGKNLNRTLVTKSKSVCRGCSIPVCMQQHRIPSSSRARDLPVRRLAGAAIPCASGAPEFCHPDEDKQLNKRCKVRARGSVRQTSPSCRPISMAPSLHCCIMCVDHAGRGRGILILRPVVASSES